LSSTTESIGCSIGEECIVLTDSLIPGAGLSIPRKNGGCFSIVILFTTITHGCTDEPIKRPRVKLPIKLPNIMKKYVNRS